jgi:hypothetical protein
MKTLRKRNRAAVAALTAVLAAAPLSALAVASAGTASAGCTAEDLVFGGFSIDDCPPPKLIYPFGQPPVAQPPQNPVIATIPDNLPPPVVEPPRQNPIMATIPDNLPPPVAQPPGNTFGIPCPDCPDNFPSP